MKAQAERVIVPENFHEYKRLLEIWCVIVTKVTTTDGNSDEPIHHGTVCLFSSCPLQRQSALPSEKVRDAVNGGVF